MGHVQCQKLDRQVTTLNARMAGALKNLRPLAAVEEDILHRRRRIQELESYQTSLAIAEGILAEAADGYRVAFSPRIQKALDQHVGLLTDGRYSKVMVGPEDLAMAEVLDTEELQEPHVLSYGTQERLCMLLRLSIAEILTHSGESIPLILDEPLVYYDDARLDKLFDLLEHVSDDHQVILFTMETRICDWAERIKPAEACWLVG